MRYYVESVKIFDSEKENGDRVTASCCDVKTAKELCFYLNEVHYDNKRKRAKLKEPILVGAGYAG